MGLYAYPSATLLSQQSVKMPFPQYIVWSPILWAPDDQKAVCHLHERNYREVSHLVLISSYVAHAVLQMSQVSLLSC